MKLNPLVSAGPCYFSFPSIEDFLDHENNSEVLEKGMDFSSGRETPKNTNIMAVWSDADDCKRQTLE
jgi:hypothetical protein